ncbi:MAG TPA: PA14 domain-containing protein [Dongiaceae bacterium]|nr:PA14 domain-containing protein [Dongiaceae bacterium]
MALATRSPAAPSMTPVAVTGFNRDVVVESAASGPPYTTYAQEFNTGEGTAFYQSGLPGQLNGLPAAGWFTNSTDGTLFQFQPYTANNVLVLYSTGSSNGTLTVTTPATYSRITLIANSGNGTATGAGTVTLHFNDGSSFTTNYSAPDWFNINGNIALQGVDRMNLNSGSASGGSAGNPRFYQTTLELYQLGISNKPLTSLSFTMPATTKSTGIYAVSGLENANVQTATVTNQAATAVQQSVATLNGTVVDTGGEPPQVTFFYGPHNGGTTAANWSNSVAVGYETGAFTLPVTGLTPGATYYFAARAVNAGGTAWATPAQSFTTFPAVLAVVTNLPASGVQGTYATLNGEILNAFGSTPTVTFFYGPANGGTNASGWSNSVALGGQTGAFSQRVTGLATNTTYYFTAQAVNASGAAWAAPVAQFTTAATNALPQSVAVLTEHNNLAHTGANLEETTLNVANVNTNTFGLIYTRPVDDQMYAQPLIMTNVDIPGKGVHNLVILATVNDSVYAYDADDPNVTEPYWTNSFINPPNVVPPSNKDLSALGSCGGNYNDFSGNMGIVGTPVIDPNTETMYLVARTKENGSTFVQKLHALDIRTGQEKPNSPVEITATYPGTGDGSVGGVITFDPARQNQRSALSLVNGVIYITWSSHCDLGPYHGWIIGYDETNLSRVVVYNDTPNGSNGGIWMSGDGISADPNGNLYLVVGNGTVGDNGDPRNLTNRGESFLKLTRNGGTLDIASWFTPYNYQQLENGDIDLGSSGLLLIPGTTLAFSGGKQGVGYLVDRDNMGGLSSTSADTNIIQSFSLTSDQLHGGMVWWDGAGVSCGYSWPASVFLQQYRFDRAAGEFILPAFAQSPSSAPGGQPGGILAISADGTNAGSGILWASVQLTGNANQSVRPGILHAYDAQDVSHELWNTEQISARDGVGNFAKFVPPTVANGKVYLATFSGRLNVYGLASGWVAQPAITPNGGTFSDSVLVTVTNATPGAVMYYTLDGTAPTTNATLYTGPILITNNLALQVKGFKSGFVASGVSAATFLNSSTVGTGTGLTGAYYSNQQETFIDPADLVRTDAVVNFNWGNGSPDASISVDHFTVRWTGTVQPPLTGTYTFYTTTDDGVRLWVNDQLVIDSWVDQGPTEHSGSIALVAQQHYNIRMEYYENGGGAQASLSWSTPLQAEDIIPQSQLYPFTNPPPVVTLTAPSNNATYPGTASVTLKANAAAAYNGIDRVDFFAGNVLLGSATNLSGASSNTLALTATGLTTGSYALTAVAYDLTGLASTSAPVNLTVSSGSGQPYGLTTRPITPAFFNMPPTFGGNLPALLSQTGIFTNTPAMAPAAALLPYNVNSPLWSDGAVKTRYFAVPNDGAPYTPAEQIGFAPTGEWTFPAGTVFVKTFELATNDTIPNLKRRLETRLLVRDTNGAVYGVTYKWRADNSEADLLSGSLYEDIPITTATGTRTQTWYYPSPSDCLVCHTPAAGYVLGVKSRQFNGNFTYPASGITDNELRALNRVGLFNPAINENDIPNYPKLASLTNLSASLEDRARSYLDSNCAQCHRPGGSGITFDARYDTPLTNQNIINAALAKGNLGYDNARVVVPRDWYRSVLWDRMNTTNDAVKMPPLARALIDTNAVAVMGDWINTLDGTPALPPPTITPNGGTFAGPVNVSVSHSDTNAVLYFTLDSSLPTTNSLHYISALNLTSNVTLRAVAFATNYNNSVAATATFVIQPGVYFTDSGYFTNQQFVLPLLGTAGKTYVLQATTNFMDWVPIGTNVPGSATFNMFDANAAQIPYRFYRVVEQP